MFNKKTNKRKMIDVVMGGMILSLALLLAVLLDLDSKDTLANQTESETISSTLDLLDQNKPNVNTKEHVTYNITNVASYLASKKSIPLYVSHKNDSGIYLTYVATEKPSTWSLGYWFVSYDTLFSAGIDGAKLNHNDVIESVYYSDIDKFEIKEVLR